MSVKPFADHGHYTTVHDAVFDVVMPYCPPNAFKVLLFVLRKTRGWKKEEDILRYEEIKAGTGIKSDTTLSKELEWLLDKKLLNARGEDGKPHKRGTRKAPAYSLNREFELRVETPENEASAVASSPENGVTATPENGASNNHTQEETNDVLTNVRTSAGEKPPPEKEVGKKTKNEGGRELMERVKARREAGSPRQGAVIHSPTEAERRDFCRQYDQARKDGHDRDARLLAFDFQVAKAAGDIEGEHPAWCGYRTALNRVLEGWRPSGEAGKSEAELEALRAFDEETERLLAEARSEKEARVC